MGVSLADRVTVTDLPEDVLHYILTHLAPRDVCAFALVSPSNRHILQDASIWSEVARRHLRISASSKTATNSIFTQSVSSVDDLKLIVEKLVFHWHVSIGVLIAGVALHRRTGFSKVTPRGGVELKLTDSTTDSAYVFGGSFYHLAVPHTSPALVVSFSIHENGPFPVEGMRLRIIHTAEPITNQQSVPVEPASSSNDGSSKTDSPALELPSTASDPRVKICLTLNGHLIEHQIVSPSFQFESSHFHVPAHLLVTAPAVNLLAVEYDRSSTTGYWLRDIALVPAIAAFPPPPESLPLPLPDLSVQPQSDRESEPNSQGQSLPLSKSRVHIQFHLQNPPERRPHQARSSLRRPSSQSRSPRSPRSPRTHSPRNQRQTSLQNMTPLMLDGMCSTRARRDHQNQQQALISSRMPKHLYHKQNHARSPRVHHSSTRPRANR